MVTFCLCACINMGERVEGNGNVTTQNRSVTSGEKIKLLGSMDVFVSQGATGVKVETDENLIPYIVTEMDGDWLEIRSKDGYNLNTSNDIKVYVTTPNIRSVELTGSGNISFTQKFSGSEPMDFRISGSGDIKAEVNAPDIDVHISGSGNLHIAGETQKIGIQIAGSGNFDGPALKTEKADVKIAGSGDAELYAENAINASIAGSGNIKYRGNAVVDSHVAGSGSVVKMQ